MKALTLLLALAVAPAALAVSPFELPWMNSDNGATYKSADHPGAVFVVESYFLGCPYCNDNAPNVNALQDEYAGDARVQILDVGIDRSDSDYEEWIAKHSPNHPVLNDGKRVLNKQLGTSVYPSTYVVDSTGKVLVKTTGTWNSSKKAQIKAAIDGALVN